MKFLLSFVIFGLFALSSAQEEDDDAMEVGGAIVIDGKEIREKRALGRIYTGSACEYIKLSDITANSGCVDGTKFLIKKDDTVRKQLLIMSGTPILAFVTKNTKFANCSSFTEVTMQVDCKTVDGLSDVDLSANSSSSGSRKVNLTHSAHSAFGYAELISDSSVRLTQLYYDGAGPKTNWIVGTKASIGVDSNTVIIDKLTDSGEAFYSDASDLSDAVPTLPAYQNSSTTLSLPIKDGKQMTWSDVSWLALYCRKVSMLFMSVNIPSDFESSR